MRLLGRWKDYARQYGWTGLVGHVFTRAVRPIWERASVQILALEPPVEPIQPKVATYIATLEPTQMSAGDPFHEEWNRRWHQGDICVAAWLGDRRVHHSWVARRSSPIGEIHGSLELKTGEAYIYDCFTDGSCRGMGIFPAVLTHMAGELHRQETHRIWIAVEAENRSSLKAIVRSGFRHAGTVRYRKTGPVSSRIVEQDPTAPSICLR